jgi:PAS domain S-box-containing protein
MTSSTLPRSRPLTRPGRPEDAAPSVGGDRRAAIAARYRHQLLPDQLWWWSPEMYPLVGLEPGVAPSEQLLMEVHHPADRARARAALAGCLQGRPFSLETVVVHADGELRTVVLTGEPVLDPAGRVTAVEGVCVDVTEGRRGAELQRVRELEEEVAQLRTAMASRAAIEQAKGILMLLTGRGEQSAFDLLAHISSHTHRKVREVSLAIAESAAGHRKLPDDISAILRDACPPGAAGH